ncbi:MAG: isoprenyl transferase [Sphingobacteriales bacterium 17-39-43]|uniref:isoprenyl transferase n=1 Tax=Daejeonella sp. TaxID=2805397 RepID=UPI000BC86B4B|nr:isoprenyl transferase [Daejeonella sp.]MCF8452931.1 isoprenyl transferase [Pedobacter sp.]OYZ33361.1 MAG: isoprenyl transferase [Sphingobacteriales bacterium 16-39-50]OZA24404.1 MAG: isoprenyl transferase [Sphingobacteriales bacterium 17-39-43]HQT22376.1 isoprenyl transferase [Daejeonella sp.]HQT56783.1 isoprenyl transferase [Daejeonella sp.]
MSLIEQIDKDKLPQHVAVIMDGNGRWAKEKGKLRVFGHQNGVVAVRDTVEGAVELGIKYLTLYAFSTENWNRPKLEVMALMELLVSTISKETKTLMDNGVRLNAIGNLSSLPEKCRKQLIEAIKKTSLNTNCTLTLALSYSSRWEITDAAKRIAIKVRDGELRAEDITEDIFGAHLNTAGIPDPELMIRTSGEHRISNYLLWQIAYAELYFTSKLWPDFRRQDLFEAVLDYQKRERRFGMTSEQLN